jgi:hypothetical protein
MYFNQNFNYNITFPYKSMDFNDKLIKILLINLIFIAHLVLIYNYILDTSL